MDSNNYNGIGAFGVTDTYGALNCLNNLHNKVVSGMVFMVGACILCLILLGSMAPLGIIVILSLAGVPYQSWRKKYKRVYKELFMRGLLCETFENVDYRWNQGFSPERVRKFGLVMMGNRFYSEDYLSATYKGAAFEQADVIIRHHSGSGKSSHTTTYFRGRMFVFKCPQKRALSLQVFSEGFMYRARVDNGWKHNKVKLESVDFNRKFDVLSANEHDAFYILTPHMMERIDELDESFGRIAMRFCGDELYLAIGTMSNSFDGEINKKLDYLAEKEKLRYELRVITDIIETLQMCED